MTTSHSRHHSTYAIPDPYLQPTVRQRSVSSSGGGSPVSFASNLAVVAGPTAPAGQYYGVFLGEPPRGFPSVHLSPKEASPTRSHSNRSAGTSNGSVYGGSTQYHDTRSKHSSVAFPTTASAPAKQEQAARSRRASVAAPVAVVRESHTKSEYQTIRVDTSTRRASVTPANAPRPVVMPPSALKRERRSTLSASSASSEELPAADLRYLCKFAMGSISECLKILTNAPLFPRLMKTDDILSRMYTVLYAMAKDPTLLNPVDSLEINQRIRQFHSFLLTVMASGNSAPDHLPRLDTFYRTLHSYTSRLETSLRIRDLETKINDLTFQHNISQQASFKIHEEAIKLKKDSRSSRSKHRSSVHQSQADLDVMHQERVVLRHEIEKAKDDLWKLKQYRDATRETKTVRFHR